MPEDPTTAVGGAAGKGKFGRWAASHRKQLPYYGAGVAVIGAVVVKKLRSGSSSSASTTAAANTAAAAANSAIDPTTGIPYSEETVFPSTLSGSFTGDSGTSFGGGSGDLSTAVDNLATEFQDWLANQPPPATTTTPAGGGSSSSSGASNPPASASAPGNSSSGGSDNASPSEDSSPPPVTAAPLTTAQQAAAEGLVQVANQSGASAVVKALGAKALWYWNGSKFVSQANGNAPAGSALYIEQSNVEKVSALNAPGATVAGT